MVRLGTLSLFAVLLALVGCGGPGGPKVYPIKGRLTKGGQPLVITNAVTGMVRASLREVRADGSTVDSTSFDFGPDGTFKILGPTRKGIQPGKYKLCVEFWEADFPNPAKEKFKGALSEERSNAFVEVVADRDLNIELDEQLKDSLPASKPTTSAPSKR